MTIDEDIPPRRHRPSFGRSRAVRGLDLFDTPAEALLPLFHHELASVTSVCEPFCGKGNLVTVMRERGLEVHASDIFDRGCPGSRTLDFFDMTARPPGCGVLTSNPPFARAMEAIEHALALEFDLVIFLLKVGFLNTVDRFNRLHRPGHLRRVHVIAERLVMHDEVHLAAGGKKAAPSQVHAWFVFDRHYVGPAIINPVSINEPSACMPWADGGAP